jgi:hypothetical protein
MCKKVVNMAGIGGQLAPEGWSVSTSIYILIVQVMMHLKFCFQSFLLLEHYNYYKELIVYLLLP